MASVESSSPSKHVTSSSGTRRDHTIQHDGSLEYAQIKLSELSNFEDLLSGEKFGGSALYKAVWTKDDGSTKEVAVKRLTQINEKEAEILSGIRHKNILGFYGAVIELPHNLYFVLELGSDEILFDYIHPDKIEFSEAHDFAVCIADAMNYLHHQAPGAPIRHNNLCSGKIFLQHSGPIRIPKIGGFGNSQFHSGTQYTKSQGWMQLHGWMPPEEIEGKGISLRSDVYSFGVVVWELLTGKIPYDGKMMFEAMTMIVDGKHPEIPSDCPEGWCQLLEGCWARDPKQRPSFRSIVNRLADFSPDLSHQLPRNDSGDSLPSPPDLGSFRFNQSFKWALPQTDYNLIEFGEVSYSGQLSLIQKTKYKEREVAARTIVEVHVEPSRFIQYMNVICRVRHDNIVSLIGGFFAPKMVALFEWMPVVLQHVCPIVDPDRLLGIATDIAAALSYLHNLKPHHLYHGSLSDRTVLLDKSKTRAKVTDFNYYTLSPTQTLLNRFPNFTDPYTKRNDIRFGRECDIYSYGVILVEMGYGESAKPQEGIEYLRESWPDLATLAGQCLKDPSNRPPMSKILHDILPNIEQ